MPGPQERAAGDGLVTAVQSQGVVAEGGPEVLPPLGLPVVAVRPGVGEHVDPVVGGMELGTGYSELTDPDEQRAKFLLQQQAREAGEEETHPFDEDFLTALEHGMPPAGGLGLGIDRVLMLLTDASSIREVILFPLHRPQD